MTDARSDRPTLAQPPAGHRRGNPQSRFGGRWWKRGLIAIGLLAVLAPAATLIRGAIAPREVLPSLTHTITRGDLIVTVTGKGSLESAKNVEIKCKVRGARIPIIWLIENGSIVEPGDELARLGTLEFEDRVAEVTKWAHVTRAAAERSQADAANAELAIPEYLEGRYRAQLMTLEKDLAIAESHQRTMDSMLRHNKMMLERGYASKFDVESSSLAYTQAELGVETTRTAIDVLKDYTRAMELETLNGNLKSIKATHKANTARSKQLSDQLKLCELDLEYCVIKAEQPGMVVYPTGDPWEKIPKIEVGANVYMGQTVLLMPDLSQMQVKVGIHESIVDRLKPGLPASVTLPDRTLTGEVSSIASMAGPAKWWNGNTVRYDTIIELPSLPGLNPGMSADVEVITHRYEDVLTVPVAAVVETAEGNLCWVKTATGAQRRTLTLGDSNDVFTIVEDGLQEGDEVILNALAFIDEAQLQVEDTLDDFDSQEAATGKSGIKSQKGSADKPSDEKTKPKSKPPADKPKQAGSKANRSAAEMIKLADKDGDGVLAKNELPEKDRKYFEFMDTNEDQKVDAGELEAAMKQAKAAKPK